MPRDLNATMQTALASGLIQPFFMAQLSFRSSVQNVWTGIGNIVYNSTTFIGVGSLGKIGSITEGVDVQAYGTSLTLSGIDPVLFGDCMTDIETGAQASVYFGLLSNGAILGAPYLIFQGTVDKPSFSVGTDTISITLNLERKMIDLSRASYRMYTPADQRLDYKDDSGFDWVPQLNDLALVFGT